jgi:hypothetical protein
VLCSTWILVQQTGSHALADTKSRAPCSTADLDLADSKHDEFRFKGIAPSAVRQTISLMSSFGFNTPSNNKSHVPPFTRRPVTNVEKKRASPASMCAEARMADLEGLDEESELAKARSQRNYKKMASVYSKALRVRVFVEGQMVLKAAEFVRRSLPSPSKFSPNWDGPYIVREVHGSGYYRLSKSNETILADPINGKWLKHYY